MLEGVRLTFPGGTEYRFNEDTIVDESQDYTYLYDGREGGQLIAALNQWFESTGGQDGFADSPLQSVFVGFGAGSRTFDVDGYAYEDSSVAFGGTSSGDPALTKAQTLANDLAQTRTGSTSVFQFEWGEYSDSGAFDPLPVVPLSTDVDDNSRDGGQGVSRVNIRLLLAEAADLSETIDDVGAVTSKFRLTPAGQSTPRLPVPADTLQQSLTQQAQEIARNGFIDQGTSPQAIAEKLLPGTLSLKGAFRGSQASDLAATLQNGFLEAPGVERVDLERVDGATSPLEGTYTLDDGTVEPIDPRADGLQVFDLSLTRE